MQNVDVILLTDVALGRDRNHNSAVHDHPGAVHREVGRRGGHLQVSAQLQRSPSNLLGSHKQLSLQTQKHLEQGLEVGNGFGFIYLKYSVCPLGLDLSVLSQIGLCHYGLN